MTTIATFTGSEPICKVLPIAPSTYHANAALQADPRQRSARAVRDAALMPEIERVWNENFQVYGVRKVWRQLRRERFDVARCTVPAGSRATALQGRSARCALGQQLHLRFDLQGFVYVAFVIDVFARRIVGLRASSSARTDFVLDALERALHERKPVGPDRLVHHSDRGSHGGSHPSPVLLATP